MNRILVLFLVLNLSLGLAAWCGEETATAREGLLLNIGGDVHIAADEQTETIVVIGGNVTVEGWATESVVVVGGKTVIRGRVDEDVVVVGGGITLEPGAAIGGDIVSVGGLLIHFAPSPMEELAAAITKAPGGVILWGIVAIVLFVPLVILLGLTIIGIPVIPLLFLTYIIAGFLGLIGCSLLLGDKLAELVRFRTKSLMGSLVIGLIVLALLRLIPVIGGLITFAIGLLGLGAVIVTRFGTTQAAS